MKLIKSYFSGLKDSIRLYKINILMYVGNLFFTLIIALPLWFFLKKTGGNSLLLNNYIAEFDLTTILDWHISMADGLQMLKSQIVWLALAYCVAQVFFTGGVLQYLFVEGKKFSMSDFFSACGLYFFRFLRLFIYSSIFHVLALLIVLIPTVWIFDLSSARITTEPQIFWIIATAASIYFLLLCLILTVSDYAKIRMVLDDSKASLKSFFKGFGFVFKNFFSSYFLFLLLIAGAIAFFYLYFFVGRIVGYGNSFAILFMFLIQQGYIFGRMFLKTWILGSEISLYSRIEAQKATAA